MDLTSYTDALRDDLVAAAALGDEDTRRTAAALAAAVEPAARLTLMAALADLAAEVTATCEDRVVEVRLDGRDVRVVVTGTTDGPAPAPAPAPERRGPAPEDTGGEVSRVTLRLFEQLKSKAEDAASSQGVSLNSWLSQTVQGALSSYDPGRRGGSDPAVSGEDSSGTGSGTGSGTTEPDDDGDDDGGQTLRGWVQG